MNQSYSSEIEKVVLNHILFAARFSLGIAWKLTVSALAVAIVVGMTAGPAAQSGSPSLNEAHPVRVEREDNIFRILTQVPSGKDDLLIELVDPRGKKYLHL